MDKELEAYYSARFEMFSSKGWKDLMEDVVEMEETTKTIDGIVDEKQLMFRKGELNIIRWLKHLEQVSEEAFKTIGEQDAAL